MNLSYEEQENVHLNREINRLRSELAKLRPSAEAMRPWHEFAMAAITNPGNIAFSTFPRSFTILMALRGELAHANSKMASPFDGFELVVPEAYMEEANGQDFWGFRVRTDRSCTWPYISLPLRVVAP